MHRRPRRTCRGCVELQKSRMQFAELVLCWAVLAAKRDRPPGSVSSARQAAQAYAIAGDAKASSACCRRRGRIDLQRYLALLRTRDPDRRLKLAASEPRWIANSHRGRRRCIRRAAVSRHGSLSLVRKTRLHVVMHRSAC